MIPRYSVLGDTLGADALSVVNKQYQLGDVCSKLSSCGAVGSALQVTWCVGART